MDLGQVATTGRDGTLAIATTMRSPLYPLTINTPPSGWASLLALFTAQQLVLTRDDVQGVEVQVRLASATPDRVFARNELIDATFVVELSGAFWRDQVATTPSAPLSGSSTTLSLFDGISAPVGDAMVRVKGQAAGIQITDHSGAWLTLPDVPAGSYCRFESATGRAFVTTTDTWTGGVEVSGAVDFGGPRGVFEITPVLAVLNPSDRHAELTIATTSRTGAVLEVRGKAAHII
ncbi:hypothetical protein [Microbacterium sp. NPDC089696]|uniref:hypothetical protein n=1 Tax=Microbacterium sp. NPDC089696 TaxID=3364199 RepID=UPI0038104A3A